MARRVLLLTANARKLEEYRRRLDAYGLAVEQAPPDEDPAALAALLAGEGVLALLREESALFGLDGAPLAALEHLAVAVNRCRLRVHARGPAGEVATTAHEHAIEGHLDLGLRAAPGPDGGAGDVFDWDDVFVPAGTLRSYDALRRLGLKLSARDLVIDDFVRERLWYRRPVELRWSELPSARTVDLGLDPAAFLAEHPVYARLPGDHPLRNVLGHVVADGLFFRAPRNRREKNYWLPGLNAGLPFVPKGDDVHEATYMFHDLMHFAFPDLLYDGRSDRAARNVYVVHRMLSEAFTLVLADMVFVDALRASGLEYDLTRRRIHPLFASLRLDPAGDPADLRPLLWANARFCLAGDDAEYRALGADPAALAAFRGKYEQFFVADYRWTEQNFRSMGDRLGARASAWLARTAPLRARLRAPAETVGHLADALAAEGVDPGDLDALVAALFARAWARLEALWAAPPAPEEVAGGRGQAFLRWVVGQLALCEVFDFVPESAYWTERLVGALRQGPLPGPARIAALRGFFDQYVDLLHARRLISADDRAVYRELYPAFAPCFVEYDVELQAPLDATARAIVT